jgi:hypothetical protein
MTVAPANTSSILVSITGVLQDPSTYSVSGTTLTFSTAPPSGTSNISVRYLGIPASGVTTTAYRTVTEFTATSGQTSFSVPSYTVGYIDVYRNGVMLGTADFTATTGTTVVLATGATTGDLIRTESFYVSSVLNALPQTGGTLTGNLVVNGDETISGNVGIGTSSPSYKLDIQQTSTTTARIATTTGSGSPGAGLMFQGSLAASKNWLIGSSYVATAGGLEFIPSTANGGTTFTTPAMILNSSGYMTIPYQPCFYATVTGSGTVAGSTVIPFNSAVVNIGSCFNTSTYRFTAPVAGTYMFIAQPSFNNAVTARVSIRKNGSFYFEYEGEGSTNGWLTTTFGSLITMAVNDYVDVYNGNNSLAYDNSRWMGFYGYLIG